MLIGRNICFLWLFLFFVKIIIVSKFFVIVKINVNINVVYYVMFFVLEGVFLDNLWLFVWLILVVDVLFILRFYVKVWWYWDSKKSILVLNE